MARAPGFHRLPPRQVAPLAAAAVDVPAFVGLAERGPLDAVAVVEGWPGFRSLFGEPMANAQLALVVRAFFENGGRRCHVARVAAAAAETASTGAQPADRASSLVLDTLGFVPGAAVFITQEVAAASAGPQPADRSASILASLDGFAAGDRVAITQAARPRIWRTVRSLDPVAGRIGWDAPLPASFDLVLPLGFTVQRATARLLADVTAGELHWSRPLSDDFSLTKALHFFTGAAAATGVIHDEAGAPLLALAAASAGAFGNDLEIRLARTVSAETATRTAPQALDALAVATLVDLAPGATLLAQQDGAAPTRRRLRAIDAAARRLLLDLPLPGGPGGFDSAAASTGTKPIRLRRETFALSVHASGRLAETHADLDLPAAGAGLTVLAERSRLIRATRLAVTADYPLPDPAAGPGPLGRVGLVGGRDGIAALRASDLIRGIDLFEDVDEPAALAVPDAQPEPRPALEILPPPAVPDPCALVPAPVADRRAPPAQLFEAAPRLDLNDLRDVQRAMIAHCEARGDRLAILDAPRDRGAADPFDPDAVRDWRVGLDSRFAALYWPWLRVAEAAGPRSTFRELPPCGHVLGAFARSDLTFGVQKAPANGALDFVQSVSRETDEGRRGLLNDAGVNVIRVFASRGIRIYGARTLAAEADHRLLNARRILIQLRRSLRRGLAWVPFEPDNFALRAQLRGTLESFLEDVWQRGALAGATRDQAFAVAFDPPDSSGDGTLVIRLAVAPVSPAEFVYLTLTRSDEALEMSEPTTLAEAAP